MGEVYACGYFEDPLDVVEEDRANTSWITSSLRAAGEGVNVDVEADALGVSVTLSVVGLLGAGINSLDRRKIGVIGSDGILDSVLRQ